MGYIKKKPVAMNSTITDTPRAILGEVGLNRTATNSAGNPFNFTLITTLFILLSAYYLLNKSDKFLLSSYDNRDADLELQTSLCHPGIWQISSETYNIDSTSGQHNSQEIYFCRAAIKWLKYNPLDNATAPILIQAIKDLQSILTTGVVGTDNTSIKKKIVSSIGASLVYHNPYATIDFLKKKDPKYVDVYKLFMTKVSDIEQVKQWPWIIDTFNGLSSFSKEHPKIKEFMLKYARIIEYKDSDELNARLIAIADKLIINLQNTAADPFSVAASIHMDIVEAHLFADSNGRTARILMNAVLEMLGKTPIVFPFNDQYSKVVSEASIKGQEYLADYLRALSQKAIPSAMTFYRDMQRCVAESPVGKDCANTFKNGVRKLKALF